MAGAKYGDDRGTFMEWYEIIITAASVLTALGVILSVTMRVSKAINKPEEERKKMEQYKEKTNEAVQKLNNDIDDIRLEQRIHSECLLAILDGLQHQGFSGEKVDRAKKDLEEHLMKAAHGK